MKEEWDLTACGKYKAQAYSGAQWENYCLVACYPFLAPYNPWTDEVPKDYDYSYTWLDDMEPGWRKAFGEQMCAEIAESLRQSDKLERYRIRQVKEKYGTLRWYDSGGTDETAHIVDHYSALSARTCCICGSPASARTTGYVCPYCDECIPKWAETYEKIIMIEEDES